MPAARSASSTASARSLRSLDEPGAVRAGSSPGRRWSAIGRPSSSTTWGQDVPEPSPTTWPVRPSTRTKNGDDGHAVVVPCRARHHGDESRRCQVGHLRPATRCSRPLRDDDDAGVDPRQPRRPGRPGPPRTCRRCRTRWTGRRAECRARRRRSPRGRHHRRARCRRGRRRGRAAVGARPGTRRRCAGRVAGARRASARARRPRGSPPGRGGPGGSRRGSAGVRRRAPRAGRPPARARPRWRRPAQLTVHFGPNTIVCGDESARWSLRYQVPLVGR